jgi:hypothetical protein
MQVGVGTTIPAFLINSRNSPRLAAGMNAELGKGVGETEVSPPAESSERSECSEPMGSQNKIPRSSLRGILLFVTLSNVDPSLTKGSFYFFARGRGTS